MKNIVILLAGGVGKRMGSSMPKQFLLLDNKPVIVYTLENFEKNESIDAILIVCVKDWIPELKNILAHYNISKVKWIIEGGDTSHDSTRNGVFFLKDKMGKDDFVVIHDAVRPILPQQAINTMLNVAYQYGNASLAIPCHETVVFTDDQISGTRELDRSKIMRVQTPQAYQYGCLLSVYERAEADNRHDFIYADLVGIYYGMTIYFSKGFTNNIKITRPEDIPLCKSLMSFSEDELFNL